MKTHLEFAKIKASKKLNTIFSGLMKLSSKHHVWRKPGTAHHLHNTTSTVVVATSCVFFSGRDWEEHSEPMF